MPQNFNTQFEISQTKFSTKSHRDEDAFFAEGFGKPAVLTSRLTYLFGDYYRRFPLSMMTYGDIVNGNNPRTEYIDHVEYEYPVMGRMSKASVVTVSNATANLGKGFSTFDLTFDDNYLKRQNMIVSGSGVQARIQKDPVKVSGGYKYTCVLNGTASTDVLPAKEALVGAKWIALNSPVSLERNRGTETNSVTAGKVRNQVSVIRKSMSWGDKRNLDRVMDISIRVEKNGKVAETNNWMSFFMHQFELDWLEEMEHTYWYSKYNKDATTGRITLKDDLSDEAIPTGGGVFEQIPNVDTYTRLTYNKLQNMIADVFFGMSDTSGMTITLYGGKGAKREFHRALAEQGIALTGDSMGDAASKFIKGEDYNLYLTGFYDSFYHIDGYYIKFKHNEIFDSGKVAQVSPKHPETGWPLESYRMVFIDDTSGNGEPNIKHIKLKGTSYEHAVILGLTDAPKDLAMGTKSGSISDMTPPQRSSEINEGSYHRMDSGGIQIMRANRCLNVECVLGLV